MFWPLLTNIPLFILYIQFGGIFNNIWQVSATTVIMMFCMKELLYYFNHKKDGIRFPYLSSLILFFIISGYVMWTASCFEWTNEFSNPYLYFTILSNLSTVFFVWSAGKDYENDSLYKDKINEGELRFQTLLQTIASVIILGICAGGYFIANWMSKSMSNMNGTEENIDNIVIMLLVISLALILLVIIMLHIISARYKIAKAKQQEKNAGKLSRINFIITISITLFLMSFVIIFNAKLLSEASVTEVHENGKDKVKMFSTDLENYLTEAETTLRVTAETINLMEKTGASSEDIYLLLLYQTDRLSKQFGENFTGLYAYENGEYMDGSGWIPPAGYDPETKDWYKAAVKADGDIVIVSPYINEQTNSVVITIAKSIADKRTTEPQQPQNVVCLDIIINNIRDITKQIDIAEKGYGLVVNEDGFIVIHRDESFNGKNITDIYGNELLSKIKDTENDVFHFMMEDEECTLFVCPILEQWYAVIVVTDSELLEDVYSQLAMNIMISLITFSLILFFYYLAYKNERNYGKQVEEMNLQVVTALATAIDAKDAYTNGHSTRVAEYSRMIASRFGYSESRKDELYMMALLHDVGKIGVPDEVINKTGRLTDEEFELIKKHPVIGSKILTSIKERQKLFIGARWHHERFCGGGYPDGISRDEIPEEARIIAVADAYDAMTSNRSYRNIMSQKKVREEIEKGSGSQFDPRFAKVMIQLIDEDTNYSMCGK